MGPIADLTLREQKEQAFPIPFGKMFDFTQNVLEFSRILLETVITEFGLFRAQSKNFMTSNSKGVR